MKCAIMQSMYKYCFFVTLTFDQRNIPKMFPVVRQTKDKPELMFIGASPEQPEFGKIIASTKYVPELFRTSNSDYVNLTNYANSLIQKCKIDNRYLGYGNKTILQKYIKRLRFRLSKFTDEKIKVFAVLEYGPETFRPHYHLLFFFNKRLTFRYFRRCAFKSWKYGRKDIDLARSNCGGYCASYINTSVKLPSFYSDSDYISPFNTKSNYFAFSDNEDIRADIYANPFENFGKQTLTLNGKVTEIRPWSSYKHRFFPKVYGFRDCNKQCLRLLYGCFSKAKTYFANSELTPSKLTYFFQKYYFDKSIHELYNNKFVGTTFSLFADNLAKALEIEQTQTPEEIESRLYNAFSVSILFETNILPYFDGDVDTAIDCIVFYYRQEQLSQLRDFYELQEKLSRDYPVHSADWYNLLRSFYFDYQTFNSDISPSPEQLDELIKDPMYFLKDNFYYHQHKASDDAIAVNRIKHKKKSDANNIFIY